MCAGGKVKSVCAGLDKRAGLNVFTERVHQHGHSVNGLEHLAEVTDFIPYSAEANNPTAVAPAAFASSMTLTTVSNESEPYA